MLACINKNSVEFQTLKKRSGLSDFMLEAYCRGFTDKYGRWPYLDELPNSNSEPSLREAIKIKSNNSSKVEDILSVTGSESVSEANIKINDQYRDLEVRITPLNTEAIIDIKHRPTQNNFEQVENQFNAEDVNSVLFLNQSLEKLANLYGFQFIETNNAELNSEQWKDLVADAKTAAAFIYNGNIYINTDVASVDAPLHEMMHLLLGSVKFSNPELYNNLVSIAEQFTGYDQLIKTFHNRTRSDINEELFVTEFARYMTGNSSILSQLDERVMHDISYNIHRLLDSVLMGTDSTAIFGDDVYTMSLKQLAQKVNSAAMNNDFKGCMTDSEVHRILQNEKAELMESGKLKEFC